MARLRCSKTYFCVRVCAARRKNENKFSSECKKKKNKYRKKCFRENLLQNIVNGNGWTRYRWGTVEDDIKNYNTTIRHECTKHYTIRFRIMDNRCRCTSSCHCPKLAMSIWVGFSPQRHTKMKAGAGGERTRAKKEKKKWWKIRTRNEMK